MLGTEDIVDKSLPDLPRHTLHLFDRLLQLGGDLRCNALEVNVVAFSYVGHGGWRVNMCAVGSDSMNGRLHDLLDQSKALILSSGQKYRLFSLGSGCLCRRRRSSRQDNGYTDLSGCGLRIRVEIRHVHEVDGGSVIDSLQASTCVEVTHGIAGLVSPGCGFRGGQLWAQ